MLPLARALVAGALLLAVARAQSDTSCGNATLALAPVASTASATVSNTGRPRWVIPPLPGEVPPTIKVP